MEPCEDLQRRVEQARRELDEHRAARDLSVAQPDEPHRTRTEDLKATVRAAEQDLADCLSSAM